MCLSTIKRRRRLNADEIVFKAVNIHYDGLITTAVKGAPTSEGLEQRQGPTLSVVPRSHQAMDLLSLWLSLLHQEKDCKNWSYYAIAICRIPAGTYVTVGIEKYWGHDTEVIVTPTLIVEDIQPVGLLAAMEDEDAE